MLTSEVANVLIKNNKAKPDTATCRTGISCPGVDCGKCLMNKGETLGSVRSLYGTKIVEPPACQACIEKDERFGHTCGGKAVPEKPQDIDGVKQPSHYMLFEGVEAIEVIARSMSVEMFKGYCLGNIMKYRLRAGKKSELATLEKDMAKATFYLELYTKHKGLCYDAE